MRIIFITILLFFSLLCFGCSSYFTKSEFLDIPHELLAQNSRVILFSDKDEKLKITARLTHLNGLDNGIYNGRQYFFLEIFNDDDNAILPDSMQISMFDKKPLWMRHVESREFDDLLFLQNNLSSGYLIAFKNISATQRKKMKIKISIESFEPKVFDFSYIMLNSKL